MPLCDDWIPRCDGRRQVSADYAVESKWKIVRPENDNRAYRSKVRPDVCLRVDDRPCPRTLTRCRGRPGAAVLLSSLIRHLAEAEMRGGQFPDAQSLQEQQGSFQSPPHRSREKLQVLQEVCPGVISLLPSLLQERPRTLLRCLQGRSGEHLSIPRRRRRKCRGRIRLPPATSMGSTAIILSSPIRAGLMFITFRNPEVPIPGQHPRVLLLPF